MNLLLQFLNSFKSGFSKQSVLFAAMMVNYRATLRKKITEYHKYCNTGLAWEGSFNLY